MLESEFEEKVDLLSSGQHRSPEVEKSRKTQENCFTMNSNHNNQEVLQKREVRGLSEQRHGVFGLFINSSSSKKRKRALDTN